MTIKVTDPKPINQLTVNPKPMVTMNPNPVNMDPNPLPADPSRQVPVNPSIVLP